MKYLNIFFSWFKPNIVPNYYFDNSLSDDKKIKKDWEMIGNDFNKAIGNK